MVKYIFITGGVISSLGKGVTAASIGAMLESRKLKINIIKFDPYINIDPGTISPIQHGEVFITEDGSETDLDLGHYERFISKKMEKKNNVTTGKIYNKVIKNERMGVYLGKTIQVIPHITDEIQKKILYTSKDYDISIIEIGGTIGDIESLPFLESIRQFKIKKKNKVIFLHLTFIPFLNTTKETKTKPTQHSVKELRSVGILPDIILCRGEKYISNNDRKKISMFTNVNINSIFSIKDVNNIYEIPIYLYRKGLDRLILNKLNIKYKNSNLKKWYDIKNRIKNKKTKIKIHIVGKYLISSESYKSLFEAIFHATTRLYIKIDLHYYL